ncbi:MAG: hypothetical protein COA74_13885 [Gammaproteobacteria bacterium]|nr:MAG: hypothetical protein COA74_13885 [Gammaproteobacteria bacterium]
MKIRNTNCKIALLLVSTFILGQPVIGGTMPVSNKSEIVRAVAIAKATLSKETGVVEAAIKLGKVQAVTWPDSSLGCAQAGMDYLQVQIEGYRIQLYAKTVDYRVHVGNGRGIVCAGKMNDNHQTKQIEYGLLVKAIQKSQQQLMLKLQLPKTAIQLSHTESIQWSNVIKQCGTIDKKSFLPDTQGYLIAFKNRGKIFNYFSDGNKVVDCH